MTKTVKLDKINRRILEVLQLNARISNIDLAEAVHLSPSACLERVKRLEKLGYIKRYLAELDVPRVGPHLLAFAEVTLENHRPQDFARFTDAINREPAVITSHKVSGRYDYLLQISVRDMAAMSALTDRLLAAAIGISKFTTVPVIEAAKDFSGHPLATLVDAPDAADSPPAPLPNDRRG
jgi:Lrp/AsnC family transcriptional regulator of ectoine degradation